MAVPRLLKAALPSFPVVNQLPGIRKDRNADPSALSRSRTGVVVERDRVAAYSRVCGFPVKDVAPLPYPHVLAFPLHLDIMSDPGFPYPALGTVHIENSMTGHRPVEIGEVLDVTVSTSAPRHHEKGALIDFVAEVRAARPGHDSELVWESTSTYLRRGVRLDSSASGRAGEGMQFADAPEGRVDWRLKGDLGRRYAAVSGDSNPIHLYPLTAKALGFPRQIAHGMWSKARCIAALENRLPDAVRVDVAFKKPILLPGAVSFGKAETDEGFAFAMTRPKDGAPHLLGRAVNAAG